MASNLGIGITTNAIGFKRKDLGGGPIPPPIPVNLISKKETIMGWAKPSPNTVLWQYEGSQVYQSIKPSLLYNNAGGGGAQNDIFLGEGNYTPNKQYLLQVEWALSQEQEDFNLAFKIVYTDGTQDYLTIQGSTVTRTMQYIVTKKHKTVQKIAVTYGTSIARVKLYNIGLYEYNSPLEAIIPAVIDETPGDLNYVTGGREIIVPTSVSNQNKVNVPLVIPKNNYPYALTIDGIYDLIGTSDEYTINIFESTTVTQVASIVLTKTNREATFIVPVTLPAGNYVMHFYSGKQGYSQNRSVKYSGVNVVEWYIPSPLWFPSDADVDKQYMYAWYDTIKQGITNEKLSQDPKLVDFSGRENSLNLTGFKFSPNSGVGTVQQDFTTFIKSPTEGQVNYLSVNVDSVKFTTYPNVNQSVIVLRRYINLGRIILRFSIKGLSELVEAGLISSVDFKVVDLYTMTIKEDGDYVFDYVNKASNSEVFDIVANIISSISEYPPIEIIQKIENPMSLSFDGVGTVGISTIDSVQGSTQYSILVWRIPFSEDLSGLVKYGDNTIIDENDTYIWWNNLNTENAQNLPTDVFAFTNPKAHSLSSEYTNSNTTGTTIASKMSVGATRSLTEDINKMCLYSLLVWERNLTRAEILKIWDNIRMTKRSIFNPLAIRHMDRVQKDGGTIPASLQELSDWFDREGITEEDMDGISNLQTIVIDPYYTGYKVDPTSTSTTTYINKAYNIDEKWDMVLYGEYAGPVQLTDNYMLKSKPLVNANGLKTIDFNFIYEGSYLEVEFITDGLPRRDTTPDWDNWSLAGSYAAVAFSVQASFLPDGSIFRQAVLGGVRNIGIGQVNIRTEGSIDYAANTLRKAQQQVKDGIVSMTIDGVTPTPFAIDYSNTVSPTTQPFVIFTTRGTMGSNVAVGDMRIKRVKFKFKEAPSAATLALLNIREVDLPEGLTRLPYEENRPFTDEEVAYMEEQRLLMEQSYE